MVIARVLLAWLDVTALLFCLLFTRLGWVVPLVFWLFTVTAGVVFCVCVVAPVALAHRLIGARD